MQDRVHHTGLKQRLTDIWNRLSQSIVDDAVDKWRKRLRACVKEKGGHFEHAVVTELELAWLSS